MSSSLAARIFDYEALCFGRSPSNMLSGNMSSHVPGTVEVFISMEKKGLSGVLCGGLGGGGMLA